MSTATTEQQNCGICLEVIKTEIGEMDGCSHPFCFTCIYEWSKVTNLYGITIVLTNNSIRCPFCKKEFRNIKKKIVRV
jgi:hypothetical protein